MAGSFSTWSIKNPIPSIVLFLVLTIFGCYSYFKMPISHMPNIVIPFVSVTITQPGAAPEEIETQVTRKIESSLAGMQGVKHITSSVTNGSSSTFIEFTLETDVDRAVNDTRDAVTKVRDNLPQSIQEPIVQRLDAEDGAIAIYTMIAPEMSPEESSWYIDDFLARKLLGIHGVAKIERKGGVDHEVTVTINPKTLQSYGVGVAEISQKLAQINADLPGGRVTLGGTEYTLRTMANAKSVELLKDTEIALSTGAKVKLSDIATVVNGGAERRSVTKLEGRPAITFGVYRTKGSSEVAVVNEVEKKLEEIASKDSHVKFQQIFSLTDFTKRSFFSAVRSFLEGALLTIFVVFVFLREGRSTLLSAIAIPLSIIPTFGVMYALGFTLNAISLLSISLVTGVLVDDAIVEVENINRHLQKKGNTPYKAAMEAAEEIGLAVVATTSVICAVFAPVSFMPGIVGKYFEQFGLTVAIAAFFSLVVARLLTPMLAAYIMKPVDNENSERVIGPWQKRYHNMVEWTLDNRMKTLTIAFGVMIISFNLAALLKSGFIPYEDYGQSTLHIELPRGTVLKQTENISGKVKDIVRKRSEVIYIMESVGENAGGLNEADLYIKYVPVKDRKLSQRQIESELIKDLKPIADAKMMFSNSNGRNDISIAVLGEDRAKLEAVANAIESDMRHMQQLVSVENSASKKQPEVRVEPDFAKAASLGITSSAISQALRVATIGDIDSSLAKFNLGTRQIPIRLRIDMKDYPSLDLIKSMKIQTAAGDAVPLSAIANIRYDMGPNTIQRYDRQSEIVVNANLNGASLGDTMKLVEALPSFKNLPEGVEIKNTGDVEIMEELFTGFAIAIGTGLLLVYAVQVLLYKDWLQPFTRMAALPLSIGGTFFLMLLTGTEISMPALIGILMLMGISDKNSILLVDYMLERVHAGMPKRQAILEACEIRARPIIMTSIAMLAGMMPIALNIGSVSSFRQPMAIAVVGGLVSSTALSLIFVPVLFSYVRDFQDWIKSKFKSHK